MSIKKGTVTIASSTPVTEWGSIEGTLADQQDLKNALDLKAPLLSPNFTGTPTVPLASEGTNTNQIASTKFVNTAISNAIENIDALPDQTSQSGKFLTTNGTTASWANIPAELPSQTGQSGKVLTTNGTTVSWTEYQSAPATDDETIHLNSSDELEVIGTIEKNAGNVKYDWIGTYAQWTAGRANETIPDSWICYITDDYVSSTVTHNIGDIFYSLRTENILNGAVVCDGSSYNTSDYSSGNVSLKSLLDGGKLPYVSISNFDAAVTAKGSCRCFGYDGGSTFKVPKLNDVFIESGSASTAGEFIDAGLPNITGNTGLAKSFGTPSGAFITGETSTTSSYSASTSVETVGIDVSQSNSIYGNSDTVQPNAVKYRAYIQLANATSESALQTVSSVVNDVTTLQEEMEETLKYKNISNCITEIPQDIKLELNNGTLTLKAGSKLYVPNGFEQDGTTPKFDAVTIESDIGLTSTNNDTWSVFIRLNNGNITLGARGLNIQTGSGTSTPTSGYCLYYNTSENIIRNVDNGTYSQDERCSFPISIVTATTSGITEIKQIFNGFGYIGQTDFVLPNVKCLCCDYRNDDGTLKSIEYTIPNVLTYTTQNNWTQNQNVYIDADNGFTIIGRNITDHHYNESKNIYIIHTDNLEHRFGMLFTQKLDSGVISNFNPKTAFHALDYNDKGTIDSWSMPSSEYIDLTLKATASTYTAPANGYFLIDKHGTDTNQIVYIFNITAGHIGMQSTKGSGGRAIAFCPCKKGDTIQVDYNTSSNVEYFRFIYAEGEI